MTYNVFGGMLSLTQPVNQPPQYAVPYSREFQPSFTTVHKDVAVVATLVDKVLNLIQNIYTKHILIKKLSHGEGSE